MLSGIWPRGNSSAPGNGNTGMISGSSPGPRYSALIGISGPGVMACSIFECVFLSQNRRLLLQNTHYLRKQNRRQPLASLDGRFIGAAPRLEELHELLARAIVVPFAVALDDREQLLGRLDPLAGRVERGRQIESGLMIERVCGDFLFQLGDGADGLRLF